LKIEIESHDVLDGAKGLVYLMFLGRETHTASFYKKFKELELLSDESQVNQHVILLKKGGYLRDAYEERQKERGRPIILTANPDPFKDFLRRHGANDKEIEEIMFYVEHMADAQTVFLDYLAEVKKKEINIRKIQFWTLVYWLLDFLQGIVLFANEKSNSVFGKASKSSYGLASGIMGTLLKEALPMWENVRKNAWTNISDANKEALKNKLREADLPTMYLPAFVNARMFNQTNYVILDFLLGTYDHFKVKHGEELDKFLKKFNKKAWGKI